MADSSALMRYSVVETNFIAEETIVTIIPNLDHPILQFVSGNFGPFQSGLPCHVPLWLALNLRKRGKCTIKTPEWLIAARLEQFVEQEKASRTLGNLPYFYMEVGHLLLTQAQDDIQDAEKVSSLLQDLENIRMDRLRLGIAMTAETVNKDDAVVSTTLNNISAMEINSIRDFFLHSLDSFNWLKPSDNNEEASYDTASSRRLGSLDFQEETTEVSTNAAPRKLRKLRKD